MDTFYALTTGTQAEMKLERLDKLAIVSGTPSFTDNLCSGIQLVPESVLKALGATPEERLAAVDARLDECLTRRIYPSNTSVFNLVALRFFTHPSTNIFAMERYSILSGASPSGVVVNDPILLNAIAEKEETLQLLLRGLPPNPELVEKFLRMRDLRSSAVDDIEWLNKQRRATKRFKTRPVAHSE
jgi:hypothetical protein